MKHMNTKKRFWTLNLQLFADEEESGDEGNVDEDDSDDGETDENEGDFDEKKFSQKDVDDAVKKRIARERRKWQREQQKKASGSDINRTESSTDDKNNAKVMELENRASKAEVKVACFEAGVDKGAIDDVAALAHSYMAADEELDLEDAIEKVVKKYPQFTKASATSSGDEEDTKRRSWGERQHGKKSTTSGVEAAFLKRNPGIKI